MDKCSKCYIVDRAKLAYCPDCKKVKKTSQDMSTIDILDKIRADVAGLHSDINVDIYNRAIEDVHAIIDKYRNEVKE